MSSSEITFTSCVAGDWGGTNEEVSLSTDAHLASDVTDLFFRFMLAVGYQKQSILDGLSVCIDTHQDDRPDTEAEFPDPPF